MHRTSVSREGCIERLEDRRLFSVVSGFSEAEYVGGLANPTAMVFAPDGRLLVTEQGGALRIVQDGALVETPALSLTVPSEGERGLLGVALDPAFTDNGFIYLYYTTETPTLHNRVSRFTLAGDIVDPGSEDILVDLPDLSAANNHNGGAMHFGDDGKLYVAVGDNAAGPNSQSLETTLGKLLQFNPDGSIPDDNPLLGQTTGLNQSIWAAGLRNPYTFAFRADGTLYINDVGESSFEEINVGTAGANYGWPTIEGKITDQTPPDGYADPLLAYPRHNADVAGNSIAGGAFYELPDNASGSGFPAELLGDYFFGDFGGGWVKILDPATAGVAPFADNLGGPVDIDVGPDGALYVLEHAGRVTAFNAVGADLGIAYRLGAKKTDAVQGDKDRVGLALENAGSTPIKGRVNVRLVASSDDIVDSADVLITERPKSLNLKPGKAANLKLNFRYPASLDGGYLLLAEVVPPTTLADTNALNDVALPSVPVRVGPPVSDLAANLSEPTRTVAAASTTPERVDVGVINLGNSRFSGTVTATLVAIERNTLAQVPLGQISKRLSIAVGKVKTVTVRFTPPAELAAGVYDLQATLQPVGKLPDPDAENDVAIAELVVS